MVFEGVHYFPIEGLNIVDLSKIDMYIPVFFVDRPESQRVISLLNPDKTRVCIMLHCFLSCYEQVDITYAPFKVDVICPSDFVYHHHVEWMLPNRMTTILNGVPDLFLEDQCQEPRHRPGQWIFFACYERGGSLARRVFASVRASLPNAARKMHICSYADKRLDVTEEGHVWHGSLSKRELRSVLDECEYFVYPLVSPEGVVHHDTFACVIAEALSRGVIVITLDVACIPSLYGDIVVQVPHIPCVGYDPQRKIGLYNDNILSEEMVTSIKGAILDLESNPERKLSLRRRGMEWAHSIPWSKQADIYMNFIENSFIV
jgi:glycosyltransferase involved in cell wall biosynthesis